MYEKKVSVVIPFYNNTTWLKEAIDSVLIQSYTNYEIILVNDGSEDNIEPILEYYKHKLIYHFQNNAGPGKARNKGIELAKGEYIAFLDSDDIWEEKKLEVQIDYMETHNLSWSYTGYKTFGEKRVNVRLPGKMSGMIYPLILDSSRIGTPTVVIKACILKNDKELRFNENMRFSQDYYLWVLLSRQHPIGAVNEVLCKVRMRGTNAEKSIFNHIKARKLIWDKVKYLEERNNNISKITRLGYFFNNIGYKIIIKTIRNKKNREIISRIFYIFPYSIFKLHLWYKLKTNQNK